ncbi:hypothetical protein [Nocardia jinanensis]|uniref:Uncharacterized protein n=1 Tax=Nocardia jinanensis TaxID=382504 RepID=A0A917RZC1_9NOCA|nr:hypothetical protein [Nocardia jinanensis]GGL43971.1 hypothetical protein GCM10011588_68400 [Nocardia jinanensis]
METNAGAAPDEPVEPDPDDESEQPPNPARHYSTGRLTAAQARVLSRWRRQLTVMDPRWPTRDHRPPASSSDCLAAAVTDLLDRAEPTHLELIRYGDRIRKAMTATRGRGAPAVSVVSFYLPAGYAARLDAMLADAQEHHRDLLDAAREGVLTEPGLPSKAYKLPAGTVARLAIDRWARRSPTAVIADAVAYGGYHHTQVHRARADMGIADTHPT